MTVEHTRPLPSRASLASASDPDDRTAPGDPPLLLAPFARLGPVGTGGAAVAQALAGLALAPLGLRFDGALDLHRTWRGDAVPWGTALVDQLAAWPVAALAGWLALRLLGHRPSPVATLFVLGAARVALLLAAAVVLAMPTPAELRPILDAMRVAESAGDRVFAPGAGPALPPIPLRVLAGGLLATAGFGWFVALVAGGVRHLTGARGWRLAGATVALVVAAELASKALLAASGR